MKPTTQIDFTCDHMVLSIFNIQFRIRKERLVQKLQQTDKIFWTSNMDVKDGIEYNCHYDDQTDSLKFSFPISVTQINSFPAFIDILRDRIHYQSVLFESVLSEGIKMFHPSIHQLELSPIHIRINLVMPNFLDSYTQPYQFELSRFKYTDFSDPDDKNLKLNLVDLPTQLSNYLKPLPLNYGIMCCNLNLDAIANLLCNCYMPIQVFQNSLSERSSIFNIFRLDKGTWTVFRQLLSFLPTTQFGIISFNYKSDTSPVIYSHLTRISHSYLCLSLESVAENGCIEMSVKLNEQYQQFMSSGNQQHQVTHTELCQLLNVPTYLEQFRTFMGQLIQVQTPITGEITKFKLLNGEMMEKFFNFFLLYLFITLIKYTYLSLAHQQNNESKLSYKVFDKLCRLSNSTFLYHKGCCIEVVKKPLIRIYQFYQDTGAKPNLLFLFTHNQLCICYFILEACKKMIELKKSIPNDQKSKIEMVNLARLEDKLVNQEYNAIKQSMQQAVQLTHPTHFTKIDEVEIGITFPYSNVTLMFHGAGNEFRLSKSSSSEDKNYFLDQLSEQDFNHIRDCVYCVGTQHKH